MLTFLVINAHIDKKPGNTGRSREERDLYLNHNNRSKIWEV